MKKCSYCGSDIGHIRFVGAYGDYLCNRHRLQYKKNGKMSEITIYDKNIIEINGDISYIIIRNKQCEEICRAIIDTEDVERCKDYKWSAKLYKDKYYGFCSNKKIMLHNYIMQFEYDENTQLSIDHINRNPLDNRKSNLRIASKSLQAHNCERAHLNKFKFEGVCFMKSKNKFVAKIKLYNKTYWRKEFFTLEEAVLVREAKKKEILNLLNK